MRDPAPFALWQDRTGLTRAVDAAKALGISRQSVTDLREGRAKPHPSTRQCMEYIEFPERLLAMLAAIR